MNYITSFILSFFIFGSLICHGQHKIDSLQSVLSNATDTLRIKVLTDLAMEFVYTDPQKSEKLAVEAIALCKTLDYHKGVAKAYHVLCISYDIRGEYIKAIESGTAGVDLLLNYQQVDSERELYAGLLNGIGLAYYHQSKYNEALTSFFSALKALDQSSEYLRVADVYNNIGLVYHDLSQLDKALEYYFKSFELAKNMKNAIQAGRSANNIGLIYNEKQDFISAIKYYQISLAYKLEIADENGISASYLNLGITYKRLKDYSTAMRYLELSESIKLKIDDKLGLLNVQDGKADILIQQKQFKEAEAIALKSLKLLGMLHTTEPKIMVYNRLYNLHESQGNYKEALEWYIRATTLKDSLFTAEKNKQALEIETKYETEKKEQTIKLLEDEKRIQLIWVYIFAGFIFAIEIIYLLQRSRTQKAKELLAIQKEYNAKLKETDSFKSRFFSNISHEFRTPLTLILAHVEETINSRGISRNSKNDLQIVKRNANRLLELVNQLMDLAKLEAKKMELHFAFGNLEAFLKTIAGSFETLAYQKKITFKQDFQFQHTEIKFDADKIEKIIGNLLMNSFKFTPAGGTVTLTAIEKWDENSILMSVEDTGIGISDEDKPHVFSPFHQVDEANTSHIGTGLGLSLVKELVNLHNGRMDLASTVNNGTKITVLLPILPSEPNTPAKFIRSATTTDSDPEAVGKLVAKDIEIGIPEEDQPLQNLKTISAATVQSLHQGSNSNYKNTKAEDIERIEPAHQSEEDSLAAKQTILVVEDNADLQNYLASILSKQYSITIAKDGVEGYESACEQIPDLIISDVMMPRMNGIDLLEKVKHNERTSHIPIILLTAKADLESRLRGLKFGADDYLAKPFVVEELFIRIDNLLSLRKKLAAKYMSSLSENSTNVAAEPSLDEKFLQKAKMVVERNISDSLFSVESLADEMHLSRAQLFRKLKAISGLPPNEFINDIRLLRAAEMIKGKVDTLTQISYSVGFNEPSYFAKRFKKKFGMTPSEFSENGK
jgi:signal transduction histidine kinase/DNA-binding response OmpR family regulator/Tfp pilus assembly protein PilF